jgi:hypothetical protein
LGVQVIQSQFQLTATDQEELDTNIDPVVRVAGRLYVVSTK